MLRLFFAMMTFGVSLPTTADLLMHCGDIERMRTWVNGTEAYGIWVEMKNNPTECPDGFNLPQNANNTDKLYSFILASKVSNPPIRIQAFTGNSIQGRCPINYVMDQ
jgi:hypothetical protein